MVEITTAPEAEADDATMTALDAPRVEDKSEKVEFTANEEKCKQHGHVLGDCLVVWVIKKDSIRQLGVGFTTY